MRSTIARALLTWPFIVVAACGDTDEGAAQSGSAGDDGGIALACASPMTECPGDEVGTWQVVGVCGPIDRECLASVAVDIRVDTLAGTLAVVADGSADWQLDIDLTCRFEGPMSCIDPQYVQYGCPGGEEPCSWSTGISGPTPSGSSPSIVGDAIEFAIDDADPPHRARLCAQGDMAELVVPPVADAIDGLTLQLERIAP